MPDAGSPPPRLHEDAALFREAVNFTAARTGFSQRLVEKDYFCTLMLAYLSSAAPELVFKGGTCLAKVHATFYRLSEDMDFVIPVAEDAPRSERSRLAVGVKKVAAELHLTLPVFSVREKLKGANRSTQYVGSFAYESPTGGDEETIKLEVGLREPLVNPVLRRPARSVMLNPVTGKSMVPPVAAVSIDLSEAYAEKFRAALTRRDVAIRDYYDIWYGVTRLGIDSQDAELVDLVRTKIAVRDNPPVDVGDERLRQLRGQLDTQLRPVLRPADFDEFEVEHAIKMVVGMARAVEA
jgi:predicted nucleotidyltransferase component of viral defense system